MKQKTKAKIGFVIHITATKKLFFYFYDVIVKQFLINALLMTTWPDPCERARRSFSLSFARRLYMFVCILVVSLPHQHPPNRTAFESQKQPASVSCRMPLILHFSPLALALSCSLTLTAKCCRIPQGQRMT